MDAAGYRVIRILAGQNHTNLEDIRERVIIIARDLSPADAIQLQAGRTLGVVTEIGGVTSHTSIVARALNIPAVVAAENAARLISGVTFSSSTERPEQSWSIRARATYAFITNARKS